MRTINEFEVYGKFYDKLSAHANIKYVGWLVVGLSLTVTRNI